MALKWLRDNLKSLAWVLWLVIAVFVLLVFFEWGGVNQAPNPAVDVAASVGDGRITWQDLQQEYQGLERQYREALGDQFDRDMAQRFNLPAQALNSLIEREILVQEAARTGIEATDEEVRRAILAIPGLQDENGRFIGHEEYVRVLRRNRMDVDRFEGSVRQTVLLGKLRSVLAASVWVAPSEVEQAYRQETEQAQVRYLELPAAQFAGDVTADSARLEEYFSANRDDFEMPEQRVLDYALVSTAQMRREMEVPEDEMRAYYDANTEEFTREEEVQARHILLKIDGDRDEQEVEAELRAIRERIEGGEDFAEVALEVSEDQGSASRGGDLGYFGRGRMVRAFEDAAFGASPGDLVGPVKSDFGFHLIEVTDRRAGGTQPFEDVSARIRNRLLQDRVGEMAEAKARDLADRYADSEGTVTAEDFRTIGSEEGLEVQTSPPFSREATVPGLGRSPELLESAFDMEVGAVSSAIQVPTGWAVFRLAEVLEPRVPELSEVEAEVRRTVEREMRLDAASQRLAELAGGDQDLEAIAAELGVEIAEAADLSPRGTLGSTGAAPVVVSEIFQAPIGEVSGPHRTREGALLYVVDDRTVFDQAAFEEQRESVRARVESQKLEQILGSIVQVRRRDLAPEYDPRIFEQFDIDPPSLG